MKFTYKFLILPALALMSIAAPALAREINVEEAGTLSELIGSDTLATTLSITGHINATDFLTLRRFSALTSLDLSKAEIDAEAAASDVWLSKKNFEANALPYYIFSTVAPDTIVLPVGLTSIGEGAFSSSPRLKVVMIGDSVSSIGDYAFYDCPLLEQANLPAAVSKLGKGAFSQCPSLKEMPLLATSLTTIEAETFKGATALRNITFPAKLTTIGEEAFYGSGLEKVVLPSSIDSVGSYAFSGMPALIDASMNNVADVEGLLYNNPQLKRVSELESVGNHGLAECPALDLTYSLLAEKAATPETNQAFMENLKSLGDYALAGNKSEFLLLSNGFAYVGSHALDGMTNLQYINVYDLGGNIPATSSVEPFGGITPDTIRLYADSVYLPDWKNDTEWQKFKLVSTTVGVESVQEDNADQIVALIDAAGTLNVKASALLTKVYVYDTNGVAVAMLAPGSESCSVDLSPSDSLIFIVKASTPKGSRVFKLQRY